jgi:hypothetical protein
LAAGNLKLALTHYQASLDIVSRLAAEDPANPEWQDDLKKKRNRLADPQSQIACIRRPRKR